MAVFVYVLESLSSRIFYVGMTQNLENRLEEHNAGKTKFTKGHSPWKLVYSEETLDFESGRKREKYLKSASGKIFLRKYFERTNPSFFSEDCSN